MSGQEHIAILKSFDDLKFNVGRKTLMDFIKGDPNSTIERNSMDELDSYGCLYMLSKGEIANLITQLIKNNYLQESVVGNGFNVIIRTPQGTKEIFEKKFNCKIGDSSDFKFEVDFNISKVTDKDREIFSTFDFFLSKYNEEQKKAIISAENNILCIAGAGSGKTTVLTKRIQFLKKFKSISERKILAITFTRKAKEEMEHRLNELEINDVKVETFNSFCEGILRKHSHLVYDDKEVRVAKYRDKIEVVNNSMKSLGISFENFYDDYFNKRQLKEKSRDELFFIFVNDVFTVIDYFKNLELDIKPFYEKERNSTKKRIAKIVHDVAKKAFSKLKEKNLRDFSDQIIDTLELFRKNKNVIPEYEHILVDEYQDVNLVQYELLKILKSKNMFVVGDPRQAIYGWRGSDVNFILNFPKDFKDTLVVSLKKNYRSLKQIVEFANLSVKSVGLSDLESFDESKEKVNNIFLVEQDNELLERRFVLEAIKNSSNPRNEIFVLARTNRILENYADFFGQNGVSYTIKSEEEYTRGKVKGEVGEGEVILATVHSIKGMEAKEVYLVSCNSLSFPNKVQDNFVLSLMKEGDDYDKEAEELRLFYVAITRAKEKLVITYTGNYSKFVTSEMLNFLSFKEKNKKLFEFGDKHKTTNLSNSNSTVLKNMIKSWRAEISDSTGLPSYMVISNKAIEDLVSQRPSNKVELLNVNGLGGSKIAKYGEEILRIING